MQFVTSKQKIILASLNSEKLLAQQILPHVEILFFLVIILFLVLVSDKIFLEASGIVAKKGNVMVPQRFSIKLYENICVISKIWKK